MFKSLILFSFLFICFNSKAQNPSFKIIFDSIYPFIRSGNYESAKSIWISYEREYVMDSQEKYLFLYESLKNDDVKFFRKGMKSLMKYNGFCYFPVDTLPRNSGKYSSLYIEKGLADWLIKKSSKFYPRWIRKNPEAYLVSKTVDYMLNEDQTIICSAFNIQSLDSLQVLEYYSHYELVTISAIAELATMCYEINNVPNSFDHGVDVIYKWEIILRHALEQSKRCMEYSWQVMSPHIEKAYLDGKISSNMFLIYDVAFYRHTGFQYYGRLEGVPIFDEENFPARIEKYNF